MKLKNGLLLFLAAAIWGVAFVAQSVSTEFIGPFTFNGLRSLLGSAALLPVIAAINKQNEKKETAKGDKKTLWIGGIACGLCLFGGSSLQQIGIAYTSVGKAGFITALYIIFVPVASGLFFKKRVGLPVWISVAIATVGFYLLCMNEKLSVSKGDLYVLICALFFTMHILVIDHFTQKADGVKMSCIQFFVCGVISCVLMLLFEHPHLADILGAAIPILYAGLLSCGVAYTLQIVGQKDMNPTVSSLILSLESVISALAGWAILGQTMHLREFGGCVLVFAAIIIATVFTSKED